MSYYIQSKEKVRAAKRHHCTLCGEAILPGAIHDTRSGVVEGDGWWTMRMHPECHAHEQKPGVVDPDWYEDVSEPAFTRAEALAECFDPCI